MFDKALRGSQARITQLELFIRYVASLPRSPLIIPGHQSVQLLVSILSYSFINI